MVTSSRTIRNSVIIGMRLMQHISPPQINYTAFKAIHSSIRRSSKSTSQLLQHLPNFSKSKATGLSMVKVEGRTISVTFEDNSKGILPFLWLRENCQCSACFDKVALGRNFLLQNLDLNIHPTEVHHNGNILEVTWNDGHMSTFDSKWLYERAFNEEARTKYRNLNRFPCEPWGTDLTLEKFDYEDLITNDEELLKWILTMEIKGATLIQNTPNDPDAGAQFIDHVGFVKMTHYGKSSPVYVRDVSNNVAFSNNKLSLHTDLPFYQHQPGLIFLQTVKQHEGIGGESIISDGLHAIEILRKEHPKAFEKLSKIQVYFWDKGVANVSVEAEAFHKMKKAPVIGLDSEGNFETLKMNNQVRDSHLDLPPNQVNSFYESLKQLDDILSNNSYSFKMKNGDILALDNVRCLHGREGFGSSSSRHLETSYLDWDEVLCRRRRLHEKLGYL